MANSVKTCDNKNLLNFVLLMENQNQDSLTAIVVLGKHLNYKDKINDELKQRVKVIKFRISCLTLRLRLRF